jgi:uncharacterized protein YjbJ (UPF0337 family)
MVARATRKYIEVVARPISLGHATPSFFRQGTPIMNKDQVAGRVEQVKGKVAEVAGKVIDNDKMAAEGKADQVAGKVQAKFGDAKEAVKDKAKDMIDKL